MSTKDILVKAREEIVRRGVNRDGWYVEKYNTDTESCKVCAMGALFLAMGATIRPDATFDYEDWDTTDYSDAFGAMDDAVIELGWRSVTMYNDSSASDEQVLDLFDKAIEKARD